MRAYIAQQVEKDAGFHPHNVLRHMVGLHKGLPGARAWRRRITGGDIARTAAMLDEAAG
jgi:hypothetical protein